MSASETQQELVQDFDDRNDELIEKFRSFSHIKNAFWNCVLDDTKTPKNDQKVDLILLRNLMRGINVIIEYIIMKAQYE